MYTYHHHAIGLENDANVTIVWSGLHIQPPLGTIEFFVVTFHFFLIKYMNTTTGLRTIRPSPWRGPRQTHQRRGRNSRRRRNEQSHCQTRGCSTCGNQCATCSDKCGHGSDHHHRQSPSQSRRTILPPFLPWARLRRGDEPGWIQSRRLLPRKEPNLGHY